MKAIVLANSSMACADMYYASRFLSSDPFVYVEVGGRRILTVWCQEVERARRVSGIDEVWDQDEFLGTPPETGDVSPGMWLPAVVVGAARRAGVTSAVVPDWFPVGCADALRAAGIEVTVDAMVIRSRRRTKSPAEVAAIEEALRVTEASLELIRERLRQATVDEGGALLLDGVALTSERLQDEVRALYADAPLRGRAAHRRRRRPGGRRDGVRPRAAARR